MDHEKVYYKPFKKAFYVEVPQIKNMSSEGTFVLVDELLRGETITECTINLNYFHTQLRQPWSDVVRHLLLINLLVKFNKGALYLIS